MTRTTRNKRAIIFAAGSLLLVSVLAMAIFSTMAGPLHITGIKSASAQTGNMTMTGNQTGNMTMTGNQTSSTGGDADKGDPDGDGI
jgi:hypothetical protein